jgi:ABC-type transport system involved in cytochrome c biogenesis ATPase subunit
MIEHINIHFPELIKSQKMLNLGKINILTGKNSSGKSTILGRILSKPDYGITIHSSEKIQSVVREQIGNYAKPSNQAIDDWVKNILTLIDGKIFFNSSEEEVYPIILDAKNNSAVNIFGLAEDIKRVSKALTTYFVIRKKYYYYHPKGVYYMKPKLMQRKH